MADTAGNSTSWWQWLANTASGVYSTKLGADVAIAQNNAALAQAQAQQNETLSFLGYDLHKKTLLWIAGGSMFVVLMLVLLKRR